jgi:GNAT superfamily N-acetyltransferase
MKSVHIRRVTPDDIPHLAELWYEKQVLLHQSDPRFSDLPEAQSRWVEVATGWLHDAGCVFYSAEREGQIIGYIVGYLPVNLPGLLLKQVGVVTDLVLDAHTYQGGLGRLLLEALRVWFTEQGIEEIVIYVPRRHAVEQAFWRAVGATQWIDVMWLTS